MALLLVLLLVSPGLAVRTTRNGQEQEVVDQNFEDMQNNPQLQALYGPEYHYRETLNQSQQSFRPPSANTPQNQSFRRAASTNAANVGRVATNTEPVDAVVPGNMALRSTVKFSFVQCSHLIRLAMVVFGQEFTAKLSQVNG